ncbi:hypothetical protein B9479_001966 [Cryptococcus floricola]|uniref:Uncharacterized protein n=1 Tax=Cryptococcus floricola TaxID=2591691 RepID=A0A5D3B370_9TREE|nr:hypothetical protein B9479_001966 [Cryptococcus floricola]
MADFRRSEDEAIEGSNAGSDTPTILPLRFANRVAVSLRTPTLYYRSFFLLSVSVTPPLQSPAYLSDTRPTHGHKPKASVKERHVLWLGMWGSWIEIMLIPLQLEWVWRVMTRGEREKGRKRAGEKPGVFEIRQVVAEKEAASSTPNPKSSLSPATAKHLRRTDSTSNLPEPSSHSSPHIAPAPESRRPSLVSLLPPTPSSPTTSTSDILASSPLLLTLKAELTTAQGVITDLQSQLSNHELSVQEAHAHLQSSLEDLRGRRKEDDAERQELKARTKVLEEQKRQAEGARREGEKKLRAVEGIRDGLEDKIKGTEAALLEFSRKIEGSKQSVKVSHGDREQFARATRQEVDTKKAELRQAEDEISLVESHNESLEMRVKEAEERLQAIIEAGEAAKKIAPEEEMIMMAAAYEAAAQEGYQHGYQHAHGGTNPWATQAAAYMAEAGMPQLGYDYTAKTASSGAGNHLSKGGLASSSNKDLPGLRQFADMTGFEDFGPGAPDGASVSRRGSARVSRDVPPQPPTAPSDSEFEIYGHDPGSPNGISSSFSANLLPQGLFSSLEGETPYVGAGEFDDPLKLETGFGGDPHSPGSGSSSGESSPHFSRFPASSSPFAPINNNQSANTRIPSHMKQRPSGPGIGSVSASRLPLLASTSPSLSPKGLNPPAHSTTPPLIPGLPSLPGSRRWVSGTMSSDNLSLPSIPSSTKHSNPFSGFGALHHPSLTSSNDSLHLPAPSGPYSLQASSSSPALDVPLPVGAGAVGDFSPFAPTEGEKKALQLGTPGKWGGLGLGKRWQSGSSNAPTSTAVPSGTVAGGADEGGWPSALQGWRKSEDVGREEAAPGGAVGGFWGVNGNGSGKGGYGGYGFGQVQGQGVIGDGQQGQQGQEVQEERRPRFSFLRKSQNNLA